MKSGSYILICALLLASNSTFGQGWIDAPSGSGLQIRTAPFCISEGNYMRVWGDMFEYTPGIPTNVESITDSSGNIYASTDKITPESDIVFVIQSTLYGISYVDVVNITAVHSPEVKFISPQSQIVCENSIIDEPVIETHYVDMLQWQFDRSGTSVLFPFTAVQDTVIRLEYTNNICGGGYKFLSISIIEVPSLPKVTLQPFSDIQDVCRGCYFPLPSEVTTDTGTVIKSNINWFTPDVPANQSDFYYGEATVTVKGDSNICGYKTITLTDVPVQVRVATIDCDPVFICGDSTVCYCETYHFSITKPSESGASKCIYTEDDIRKTITPDIHFDTISTGNYSLTVTEDSFEISLYVNVSLQCPEGALYSTVQKDFSYSASVKTDESKCPVPVEYLFCRGDSGFIYFQHTLEKHVTGATFFPPHTNSFIYDSLRSNNIYTVYRTTDTIITPGLWESVNYRVKYRIPKCDNTEHYYDSVAVLSEDLYCSPEIIFDGENCSGSPISIYIIEHNHAIIIDSVVIESNPELYTFSEKKYDCINHFVNGKYYGCDYSSYLIYELKAYAKKGQDYTLNIPVIVYYRDFADTIDGEVNKKTFVTKPVSSCPVIVDFPAQSGCMGEELHFNIRFMNPTTEADSIKINFDSTEPHSIIVPDDNPYIVTPTNRHYYFYKTVLLHDSVLYKIDVEYNEGDSLRYQQLSITGGMINTDCNPSVISSKDTACSGDSIFFTVINNNPNATVHSVVWITPGADSIAPGLYGAVADINDSLFICDIFLSLLTADTLVSYRDTVRMFLYPKPKVFITDTIYICQNSVINLHDYELSDFITSAPMYALTSDPAFYLVYDPVLVNVTANCKFHCDRMIGTTNYFEDKIYIAVDKTFSLAPIDDIYACIDSVVSLSIISNGRLVTWIKNDTDTLAKNIPVAQIIYDTTTETEKTYTVICSNSCNTFLQTFTLYPASEPAVTLPEYIEGCYQNTINISPDSCYGCENYFWYYNLQTGNKQIFQVFLYDLDTLPLYLTVSNKYNCKNSDSTFIYPKKCEGSDTVLNTETDIKFPTAFTPDGNGLNDYFLPILPENPPNINYELIIYNRIGERIFHTTNPLQGWNGTFRGKPCQGGVYIYRCTAFGIDSNRDLSKSGTVTLVR